MHIVDRSAVEAALQRILTSEAFSRLAGLRRFLHFVVTETLDGRSSQIKEYSIGVLVYARGSRFDPRCDAIVRVEARKLRERLDHFYSGEGMQEPVLIHIPKGAYVPTFQLRQPPLRATHLGANESEEHRHKAWHLLHTTCDARSLCEAHERLRLAVRANPNDPAAYASLAIAYGIAMSGDCLDPREGEPLMRMAAAEAMRLDPERSECLTARCIVAASCERNPAAAVDAIRRAVSNNPRDPMAHTWCCFIHLSLGEHEQTIAHARQAARLQPISAVNHTTVGSMLFFAHRFPESCRQLETVLELSPEFWLPRFWLSRVYSELERHEEAVECAERAHNAASMAVTAWTLGYVLARAGRSEQATEILASLSNPLHAGYVPWSGRAALQAALGRTQEAAASWSSALAGHEWGPLSSQADPAFAAAANLA